MPPASIAAAAAAADNYGLKLPTTPLTQKGDAVGRVLDGVGRGLTMDVFPATTPPMDWVMCARCTNLWGHICKRAAKVRHGGDKPSYHSIHDTIYMPYLVNSENTLKWYKSLFHEAVHATGHDSRLGRIDIVDRWGTQDPDVFYKEELTAELGAMFLLDVAEALEPMLPHCAGYVSHWLSVGRGVKRLQSSSSPYAENRLPLWNSTLHAVRATNYLLGFDPYAA